MKVNRRLWLAAPAAAFAVALLAGPASASTVDIIDDAHVLDATTVQNEAATLPAPILIWTTTQDAANRATFDNDVRAKVSSAFPIAMGINTQAHHETLQMLYSRLGLSQSAAIAAESSANSAFDNTMRSQNNYTAAVTAALTSLRGSLANRGGGNRGASGATSGHSSSVGGFITFGIIVIVLIVAVLLLRRLFRPRRRRMMPNQMMGGGVNQGYGPPPGYGPGGYGPGYGGGYGGGGMGPVAGGAIGAVGGGLVGYELGKMAGENDQFRRDEMDERGGYGNQNYDNQNYGDQGGGGIVGQDSDWGGGGGGDFGGGGDSGGGGGGDW